MLKKSYSPREADDIANLAFIGGKTNRQISDKPPAQYFPQIISKAGTEPFDAQCIPTAGHLLESDNYKQFLAERRQAIAARLNDFLSAD